MLKEQVFLLSSSLCPDGRLSRVALALFTPKRWLRGRQGSWETTGSVGRTSCPTAFSAPFKSRALFLLVLLLFPLLVAAQTAENPDPAVQAILFYSPTCPHCHQVINSLLIPLQDEYGEQLQIIGIDTSNPAGQSLYERAIEHFEIPDNRRGVPTLIVNDTILVGSLEIPEQFPGIVDEGLAAGGIGWPDIPDLALIVPDLPPSADPAAVSDGDAAPQAVSEEAVAAATAPAAAAQSLEDAEKEISSAEPAADPPADPAGFTLAWVVLIGMAAALLYALRQIIISWPLQTSDITLSATNNATWLVPLLALLGLGVALYLAYVEVNHVAAVCGPVGECNIVQSSPYAQLFGIPIAVLGLLSYLAIIALWFGQQILPAHFASWSSLGLILLTIFGTLFSIYLTLLELFAIKAICLWCLSSAVITTLIMVLIVRSATAGTKATIRTHQSDSQIVDSP